MISVVKGPRDVSWRRSGAAAGLPTSLPPVPGFGNLPIPSSPLAVPDLAVPDFNAIMTQTSSGYIQPAAAGYWQAIQNQFNLEGASQGLQQKAQQSFADAFNSYTGTIDTTAQGLIDGATAATGLVLNDRTIVGAVQNVEGLIQGVQSGNAVEIVQAFSGCMIAVLAASGTLTAGVGAAIAIGVAALDELISLFTPSVAATVCGFNIVGAAPTWYWNCAWSFGEKNTGGPNSTAWRKFPVKGNAADAWWYTFPPCIPMPGTSQVPPCNLTQAWSTQWTSSDGIQAWWGCVPAVENTLIGRPIDAAFPQYKQLEFDSQVPPANAGYAAFINGYFGAWQAAQEYNFNGVVAPGFTTSQRGLDDILALQKFWQMWNFAHSPSSTHTVNPAPNGWPDLLGQLAPRPAPGHTTYVEILVNEAKHTSYNEMLAGGTSMVINTGPPITAAMGQAPVAAPSGTTGTTIAKWSFGLSAATLTAVGIYAVKKKIGYAEAWQRLYGKLQGTLKRRV